MAESTFGSGGVRVVRPDPFAAEVPGGEEAMEDSFENVRTPPAGVTALDEEKLLEQIVSASNAEQRAIAADRASDYAGAVDLYDEAAGLFRIAEDAARLMEHRDAEALTAHRADVQKRAEYLRTQAPTWPGGDVVPVEQHIQSVHLTIGAGWRGGLVTPSGGAALLGGAVGFLTLGPLGAVVSAAAFAYAATRPGPVGNVSRKVGGGLGAVAATAAAAAAKVGEDTLGGKGGAVLATSVGACMQTGKVVSRRVQDFGERHQVSTRVVRAGTSLASATSAGLAQAREFNEKHRVTDRVTQGALSAAANVRSRAATFDEKHRVAEKVGGWLRKARASTIGQ